MQGAFIRGNGQSELKDADWVSEIGSGHSSHCNRSTRVVTKPTVMNSVVPASEPQQADEPEAQYRKESSLGTIAISTARSSATFDG